MLHDVKLAGLYNFSCECKYVTIYGGGGYTSLIPSCIFSDGYDLPNPQDLHRCSVHFGTIRLTTQLFVPDTCLRVSLQPFLFKTYQIHVTCSNVLHEKQEAQLMLTDQRDAFRGQSRSPNVVPFDRLGMVSYYYSNFVSETHRCSCLTS